MAILASGIVAAMISGYRDYSYRKILRRIENDVTTTIHRCCDNTSTLGRREAYLNGRLLFDNSRFKARIGILSADTAVKETYSRLLEAYEEEVHLLTANSDEERLHGIRNFFSILNAAPLECRLQHRVWSILEQRQEVPVRVALTFYRRILADGDQEFSRFFSLPEMETMYGRVLARICEIQTNHFARARTEPSTLLFELEIFLWDLAPRVQDLSLPNGDVFLEGIPFTRLYSIFEKHLVPAIKAKHGKGELHCMEGLPPIPYKRPSTPKEAHTLLETVLRDFQQVSLDPKAYSYAAALRKAINAGEITPQEKDWFSDERMTFYVSQYIDRLAQEKWTKADQAVLRARNQVLPRMQMLVFRQLRDKPLKGLNGAKSGLKDVSPNLSKVRSKLQLKINIEKSRLTLIDYAIQQFQKRADETPPYTLETMRNGEPCEQIFFVGYMLSLLQLFHSKITLKDPSAEPQASLLEGMPWEEIKIFFEIAFGNMKLNRALDTLKNLLPNDPPSKWHDAVLTLRNFTYRSAQVKKHGTLEDWEERKEKFKKVLHKELPNGEKLSVREYARIEMFLSFYRSFSTACPQRVINSLDGEWPRHSYEIGTELNELYSELQQECFATYMSGVYIGLDKEGGSSTNACACTNTFTTYSHAYVATIDHEQSHYRMAHIWNEYKEEEFRLKKLTESDLYRLEFQKVFTGQSVEVLKEKLEKQPGDKWYRVLEARFAGYVRRFLKTNELKLQTIHNRSQQEIQVGTRLVLGGTSFIAPDAHQEMREQAENRSNTFLPKRLGQEASPRLCSEFSLHLIQTAFWGFMKGCIEQYFTDEEGTTTLDPEEIPWSPIRMVYDFSIIAPDLVPEVFHEGVLKEQTPPERIKEVLPDSLFVSKRKQTSTLRTFFDCSFAIRQLNTTDEDDPNRTGILDSIKEQFPTFFRHYSLDLQRLSTKDLQLWANRLAAKFGRLSILDEITNNIACWWFNLQVASITAWRSYLSSGAPPIREEQTLLE